MRIQRHGPIRLSAPDDAVRVARRLLDDEEFAARVTARVAELLVLRAVAGRPRPMPADGHLGAVERAS